MNLIIFIPAVPVCLSIMTARHRTPGNKQQIILCPAGRNMPTIRVIKEVTANNGMIGIT